MYISIYIYISIYKVQGLGFRVVICIHIYIYWVLVEQDCTLLMYAWARYRSNMNMFTSGSTRPGIYVFICTYVYV